MPVERKTKITAECDRCGSKKVFKSEAEFAADGYGVVTTPSCRFELCDDCIEVVEGVLGGECPPKGKPGKK